LYHAKCSATAAFRFSIFLLKALVNLVNRRMDILIVRFWRSLKLVEMWASSGAPTGAYAWSSIEGSDKHRFYAVLHVPPISSPADAVRAAIVADYRGSRP
jgi:hypothetical protein